MAAQKFYVDTSIWRDYHENRKDKFRPLGEWALEFIKKAVRNDEVILYSDLILDELRKDYDEETIKDILRLIDKVHLLQKVKTRKKQFKEAAKLSKERNVPFGDALHAIIARDNKATIITRDAHFEELQDITESKKPEELL